ncbi:MAG: BlaI/MecI/CopY family transcriptional regulator [Planctomycetaceae bacterium]
MSISADALPDAELDVMSCLWQAGSATASEIREALSQRRPMAHATVCTLLKRLEDKGCVTREKGPSGKAFVYQAAVSRSGPARSLLRGLCDRVFGGDAVALVASLMDSRPPTAAQLRDLEQLVKDLRQDEARRRQRGRRASRDH